MDFKNKRSCSGLRRGRAGRGTLTSICRHCSGSAEWFAKCGVPRKSIYPSPTQKATGSSVDINPLMQPQTFFTDTTLPILIPINLLDPEGKFPYIFNFHRKNLKNIDKMPLLHVDTLFMASPNS